MSAVTVVVIDCTETGESLPTPTPPTFSCRVLRRGASTGHDPVGGHARQAQADGVGPMASEVAAGRTA